MGNEHVLPQLLKKIFEKKNLNKKVIKIKIKDQKWDRSFLFVEDAVRSNSSFR